MSKVPTPHIEAKEGEIAKVVLMPGDPLRAKFIAETFLEEPKLVNSVRNMYGYTGKYNGVDITVMGSGMGQPSIGIYSYELFAFYGVEVIIRIGSAGSYVKDLEVYDCVLTSHAYSESNYAKVQCGCDDDVLYPSSELNQVLIDSAKDLGLPLKQHGVHSSDVFYRQGNKDYIDPIVNDKKCGCVEMESFALFSNANVLGKKATCMLTISDSFVTDKVTSSEERQTSFTTMMKIALEGASRIAKTF